MRRSISLSLVILLVLAGFTLIPSPVSAAFPPPVADAGDDQTVEEGDTVTLDGSGSYDLNPDDKLTYKWDFDSSNGSNDVDATGEKVTVVYEDSGIYTVTLTVSDGDREDTDNCRITVLPTSVDNTPPVAIIRAPLPGVYNVSEPIDFDGTGFDADDDPLTGEWDFGDDTTSKQPKTKHTYNTEGTKFIRWKVNDGEANNTARVVIYIGESTNPGSNRRPDAVINVTKTNVSVNEKLTFTASDSSDPDEDDTLTYEWDFDLSDGLDTDSTEEVVKWSWNETGDYTVTLQVRDGKQGGWDIASQDIRVVELPNDPPEVDAGNDAEVQVGISLTFRGTAMDPDGDNITLYAWDFGDGYVWESDETGQTNHSFREPGTYTATFTAEDERGATGSDTRMVIVNPPPDMPPKANAGEDMTVMDGDTVVFQGRGTDDFGIAKYEWDFNNDGIWDWESDHTGSTTWVYPRDGVFTAILRVTDDPRPGNPGPGQTDEDSLIVMVKTNLPPTAKILVTTPFVQTGDPVNFVSDSEDPEGYRLDHAWDLDGDGTTDSNAVNPLWTYRREGNYRVTLTVTDDFGQSDTDQVTMQVTQTYSVEIEISSPIQGLHPGESHEFRATITNSGNGDDQIRISLSGKNNNWATLDRTLIDLSASEKQTITITVEVGDTALSTDEVLITVTASSNYGRATDDGNIEVHVKQHSGLTMEIDVESVSIERGQSREDIATITITNTGNGPDTFRISFSGDIAGYLRTSTPKVDLAPGESRDVTVSIDVVESATTGTVIGKIIVSSTQAAAKQTMDFEIDIAGGDADEPVLQLQWWMMIIIVIAIAGVVGLIASAARRKRPGNSTKATRG